MDALRIQDRRFNRPQTDEPQIQKNRMPVLVLVKIAFQTTELDWIGTERSWKVIAWDQTVT